MGNKFETFTPSSRYILSLAEEEAERLQHTTIGTPHILLGMIRSEYGVAGLVLREMGLELNHVRDAVRMSSPEAAQQNFANQVLNRLFKVKTSSSQENSKQIDLSPQVKHVLELAVNKARRMGDHHIGTEHLLLGMVQHKGCKALVILDRFGITTRAIRSETTKLLKEIPDQTSRTDQPPSFSQMERFTEKSKQVLYFAQEEAKRLQHSSLDTQHILAGLIRENESIASRVLLDLNIDLDQVEAISNYLSPEYDDTPLNLAPDTKNLIELSINEAYTMGKPYIGTEHLLLGLVQQEKSIAFNILKHLNISPEDIQRQLKKYI